MFPHLFNLSTYELNQFYVSTIETIEMTVACGFFTLVIGLPLALILVATAPDGLKPMPVVHRVLGFIINIFRSIPFIILLVALIPFTRFIMGTFIGTQAAILPLSIATIPYFTRIAEASFREVDQGLIEAVRAMGGSRIAIIREVILPESLPSIISGFTVTVVLIIGISAMAGAIGAGGLGNLAIVYGFQEFRYDITLIVVVILVIMVSIIQWIGDYLARRFNHRNNF
ncbi:MAG: methionine ABC transporter permease [Commensalibacter sp.]